MIVFKLKEAAGVIQSITVSTGEEFNTWQDFRDYCDAEERTIYGAGVHQLTIGLKGAGEKPYYPSFLRSGILGKVKYKKTNIIDISPWIPSEDDITPESVEAIVASPYYSLTPSGSVSADYFKHMPYAMAGALRDRRPSLQEAIMCSSRLPGLSFRPAYQGGMLSSPAENGIVYDSVSSYDINSCYPYAALSTPVPSGQGKMLSRAQTMALKVTSEGDLNVGHKMGFIGLFFFKGLRRKEWVRVPTLRSSDGPYLNNGEIDNIGILSGDMEIACTPYELKTIMLQYYVESVDIVDISVHPVAVVPPPVRDYLLGAYEKKRVLPKGSLERDQAKLALNTIIGFWGSDPFAHARRSKLDQGLTVEEYSGSLAEAYDRYAGTDDKVGYSASHPRVWDFRWAAYLTSAVRYRIAMADLACYKAGLNVLYSDTDSIKVQGYADVAYVVFGKLNSEISSTHGLGKWVEESDGYTKGAFRGVRKYVLENDRGERDARLAGVKTEEASEIISKVDMLKFSDPSVKVTLPVTRRSAGKVPESSFGFTDVYAFRTLVMNY